MVLGVADARQYRAVLHKLLLVEAHAAKASLDDAQLILVVIDAESTCKAGTNARQWVAIAAQQANAEGMKCRDIGRSVQTCILQEGVHTLAHFPGGLIGKSHSQYGGWVHLPRGDDMGDTVGNYPGFTASGSGQNEDRAIGLVHRFPLLRIEASKEIHEGEP